MKVTNFEALELLQKGKPLVGLTISGQINLETNKIWNKEVIIENCEIEYFSGSVTRFNKVVKLSNTKFKKSQFVFTYFQGGLQIENCVFEEYLDFQSGGHYQQNTISICNNYFHDFVNFFDCWFESLVLIKNNQFLKGTNLLGKPHDIPVTFEVTPIIENNLGVLDLNIE